MTGLRNEGGVGGNLWDVLILLVVFSPLLSSTSFTRMCWFHFIQKLFPLIAFSCQTKTPMIFTDRLIPMIHFTFDVVHLITLEGIEEDVLLLWKAMARKCQKKIKWSTGKKETPKNGMKIKFIYKCLLFSHLIWSIAASSALKSPPSVWCQVLVHSPWWCVQKKKKKSKTTIKDDDRVAGEE